MNLEPMAALPALDVARPWALWALALAVPIILLHLYFRKRRRVTVSFLPLFRESLLQTRDVRRWRRMRDLFTLLARLGALGCLALALAGVRPVEAGVPVVQTALVLDADVTTHAKEHDGRTRHAHGLERARAWIESLPRQGSPTTLAGRVMCVRAGSPVSVIVRPTHDRSQALDELKQASSLEPAHATTSLPAAIELARSWLKGNPPGRLVVLSSRAVDMPSLTGDLKEVDVVVEGIGMARLDVGIADWSWKRDAEQWKDIVRVELKNFDASATVATVRLSANDVEVESRNVALDAESKESCEFLMDPPERGAWVDVDVRVKGDCFERNNRVTCWSPSIKRPSLLIVKSGKARWYVASARDALIAGKEIDLATSGSVSPENFAKAARRSVTLVDGTAILDSPLPPGAYIFLAPFSGTLPFDVGSEVKAPLVWRTESDHPLMQGLDFTRTFATRATALRGEGLRPLAFAEGLPVVAEGERGGVRFAAFGIHPDASLLPLRTALPLWIRKAVHRFGTVDREPLRPFYRSGEAVRPLAEIGQGIASARVGGAPAGDVPFSMDGPTWSLTAGLSGRVELRPQGVDRVIRTAAFDFDPGRTVVAARIPGELRKPSRSPTASRASLWRNVLLAIGLSLLVADLLFTWLSLRRERRLRARVVAA